jgi:membrane protein
VLLLAPRRRADGGADSRHVSPVRDTDDAERSEVIQGKRMSPAHAMRAREIGRGRRAREVRQIPKAGWMDIILRAYTEMNENRLVAVAAGVTFYTLLAIFPGIGAFVSLYGLYADPAVVNSHLAGLSGLFPAGAV